jgi:adenylate cyclase
MSDGITILAVDDKPQNLRLLDAILSPRGYHLTSALSGRQALGLLADRLPDLLLLDIVMPEMDGYQLCRAIRANPRTAYLPIVMLTASGEQEKVCAIEAGADDFITKPLQQGELLARIHSLIRIKRYHDTIERQAAELSSWNSELERRVNAQVEELQRMSRLRRFLSPQLAELVIDTGDETFRRVERA